MSRASGPVSGDLSNLDLADATLRDVLHRVKGGVAACGVSKNGAVVLSAGGDTHLRVWSTRNGLRQSFTSNVHESDIYCLDVSGVKDKDSGFLDAATGSADHTIRLWSMRYASDPILEVEKLKGHRGYITCLQFHPLESWLLASSSGDRTVRIWDLKTFKCTGVLMSHKKICFTVAWSQDGNFIASGGADKHVKLWDAPKKRFICTLKWHSNWVNSVAFSGHARGLLASGGSEGEIRLWDIKRKRCTNILRGHLSWVRSLAFCQSTGLLASGGDDRTVRLWDMDYTHHSEKPSCVQVLTGHTEFVMDLSFSPSGQGILVSASFDNTCKLWNLNRFDLQSTSYLALTAEAVEAQQKKKDAEETEILRMTRELEVKRSQHLRLLKREAMDSHGGTDGTNVQIIQMRYDKLKRSAERGDAEAMYSLGLSYDRGDVPELEGREAPFAAYDWYVRSAQAGSAKASNKFPSSDLNIFEVDLYIVYIIIIWSFFPL